MLTIAIPVLHLGASPCPTPLPCPGTCLLLFRAGIFLFCVCVALYCSFSTKNQPKEVLFYFIPYGHAIERNENVSISSFRKTPMPCHSFTLTGLANHYLTTGVYKH